MLATAGKYFRSLHLHSSPCASTDYGLAADESLKFWKVFERKAGVSASASREGGVGKSGSQMAKQMTIR
jgi:cell division cycle protein 20 (cofactor of APC complex)